MSRKRDIALKILWGVILTADVLLGVLTIAAAYGGMVDPRSTPLPAAIAMTFPVLISATIIAGIILLIFRPRIALINLLTTAVCISPLLSYCPIHPFRPDIAKIEKMHADGEKIVKVMTYNAMGFMDMNGNSPVTSMTSNSTISSILSQDADIVVCQEGNLLSRFAPKNISQRQIDSLNNRYPHQAETERGMRIWSKYPFRSIPVEISDRYQLDVCRYDIDITGDTLHLFNIHMQSLGLTGDDKQLYMHLTEGEGAEGGMETLRRGLLHKFADAERRRASQAQEVVEAVSKVKGGRVLLCGDFNDIPGSYAARVMSQGAELRDAYRDAAFGPAITYHANRFYFRIDHMMYSGDIAALRVDKIDCPSSDHYPLTGYFRIY